MSNQEVGDLLNKESGNDWDESAYRKKYTERVRGYEKGYEKGYKDGINSDDTLTQKYLQDIEEERKSLFVKKKQVQDQMREYRKFLTVEARTKHLQETLFDAAREVSETKPLEVSFDYPDRVAKEAILQISDWHYGEVVEQFNNTYNKDICKDRVKTLTENVIKHGLDEEISILKVLNLGDMVSGNIRVSARVLNEQDIITQIIEVSELISEMLSELSKYFDIEYYSVLDNHSRVNANYAQHIEEESYARLTSWYIKGRLEKNSRIEVIENRLGEIEDYDIGTVPIFDEKGLFVHGHNDRINTIIPDITMLSGIKPISIFMGHLHSNIEKEEHCIDLIANPSLIGSGRYSKQIRRASLPRQKMTIYVKDDNNKVYREKTYFINV